MKSYEEFRSAVFEKAEKYEARRKARNKKIAETVSLCSLALVIVLSAYIGLLPALNEPDGPVATLPSDFSASDTTGGDLTSSNGVESHLSDMTAQSVTTETTSVSESGSMMPIISKLEFRATAKNPNFAIGKTELAKIETYSDWQDFLSEHTDDYPELETNGIFFDSFDEAYFEENTLVIVQYAGYDILTFGSDRPTDPSAENEKYMFYINLRENKENTRRQIHIMSVDKKSFKDAEIRVWSSDNP